MPANATGGEVLAVVSTIDPQTVTSSAAAAGDGIDMSRFEQCTAFFLLGDMASGTIDCILQQETVSSFDDSVSTLLAATQLAASATVNDNKQIVLSARSEDLAAGDRYVRPQITIGDATGGPVSCVVLGHSARYEPAADFDLATVVEIKNT